MRGQRVTIVDVADRLGLTKGTVSRALNNYADISEDTRRRVSKAAQEMGYVPLASAQSIKTGRSRALGLVLEIDAHDQHSPFLTDFIAGITQAASHEGWTLTIAAARYGKDLRDTVERLRTAGKADGFIVQRTRVHDDRIEYMADRGIPFILYGRTRYGEADQGGHSWFDISGERAMSQAYERLAGLGHQRIAFVGFDESYNFTRLRYEGFLAGCAAAGHAPDPELCCLGVRNGIEGEAATLKLMQLAEPPTAIVFATDEAAFGGYEAAARLGLRIGEDLSMISYDGVPRGRFLNPTLSSYHVDNHLAGETLARLLIRQLRGEPASALTQIADAVLFEGGSHGPPRKTSQELARSLAGKSSVKGRNT